MTPENIADMEKLEASIKEVSEALRSRAPAKGVIVTAVAAGLMSEAWVTNGLGADEIVALLHGERDEESNGLLAAYTACAEHVQASSKFGGIMYKMLMGLVALTGQERIPGSRARSVTPAKTVPKLVLEDVESDKDHDTLKLTRFQGNRGSSDRAGSYTKITVNDVNAGAGAGSEVSEYVLKGLALAMVTGEWPTEEEIEEFSLGDAPELADRSRFRMRHSQPTLSKILAKVMECVSKSKSGSLSACFEKLRSQVFTLASDMNRRSGEVAAATGRLYSWWNNASEMLQGNSIAHAIYIEKHLESSKGWGIHVVVDMTSMFIVFERMIGGVTAPPSEGRDEDISWPPSRRSCGLPAIERCSLSRTR